MPHCGRLRSYTLAGALGWVLLSVPLDAQTVARVREAENVRTEPNGEVVARLEPGATFAVVGRQDRWLQVDMEGWVWSRSLQATDQGGFDVTVSEPQGENLRAAPSGVILGRLGRATLLQEVERIPGWIKVRRRVWIWAASVVETSHSPSAAAAGDPSEIATSPSLVADARHPGGFVQAAAGGAALLTAAGGDTLARAFPGAEMQVLSREGSWARVRLEGWAWMPEAAPVESAADPQGAAIAPSDLSANPTGYLGRAVSWQLQFISLEHAEKVRTDFFEGEPFLLTRFGGADGPFVYVAVAADRVKEFEGLVPLERLSVTGRVRTGASSLTGTPIIDLVSLERVRDGL